MGGLTGALNIAKNALLAFQTGVQVTSHNVANVDTEGYSRQKVVTTPYPPSPSPMGPLGSGVKIEKIKRYFDAFLEANLNLKRTSYGLFSAEEAGMRLVESVFNETTDLGLSKLIDEFFSAWQTLSVRPEGLPERRLVVEKGKLLAESIAEKFGALKDLEKNIGVKLESVVEKINSLAQQIAELNLQITTAETGGKEANDLRDQRDRLIGELSELVSIRYFENKDGAYNVVMGKGFNLVDVDKYWELEVSGTEVYWRGHRGEFVRLTSREVSGGELGGWLKIFEQVSDEWNHEYVSSNLVVVKNDGNLLTEDSTFRELGVPEGATFTFTGTDHFGNLVTGSYTVTDENATVKELLNAIEEAFSFTVSVYLKDGRLFVKDLYRGPGKLSFSFTQSAIPFGEFNDPGLNYRVEELNLAGKLSLLAEEIIRTVNRYHSTGVGLKFFTGELEGVYQTSNYIKNLPFFLDLNRSGSLFVWVKDPSGRVTPVRVEFSLTPDATLLDVALQINEALEEAGFSPVDSVRALVREGKLVFQAQEGWGFAFSNDTSGILASAGINVFFTGKDAGSIEVNPLLSTYPEYVAAARLDREATRTEEVLFSSYRSRLPLTAEERNAVFHDPPHKLFVRFYDAEGNLVTHSTEDGFVYTELSVEVEPGDTLEDILGKLDQLEGLRAYIDSDGYLRLELDPNYSGNYAHFELGTEPLPWEERFLRTLRDLGVWVPVYESARSRYESSEYFLTPSGVTVAEGSDVTLTFTFFDLEGRETGRVAVTVSDGTTLEDLVTQLNALEELRAGFSEGSEGHLYLLLKNPPAGTVSFEVSVSGGDGDGVLELDTDGDSVADTTLSLERTQERYLFSGLEPVLKPDHYIAEVPQDKTLVFKGHFFARIFDENGNELVTKTFSSVHAQSADFAPSATADSSTSITLEILDAYGGVEVSESVSVSAGDTLSDIARKINQTDHFLAEVFYDPSLNQQHLVIFLKDPQITSDPDTTYAALRVDDGGLTLSGTSLNLRVFDEMELDVLDDYIDLYSEFRSEYRWDEFSFSLEDGAVSGARYFVVESRDTWGAIALWDSTERRPYHLYFTAGALENWLFDEVGSPIDADSENSVVDPFRVELKTSEGLIQLVHSYRAEENARWGLTASVDPEGRLVIETSGLYETRSFVVTDAWRLKDLVYGTELSPSVVPYGYDGELETFFVTTDETVELTDAFYANPNLLPSEYDPSAAYDYPSSYLGNFDFQKVSFLNASGVVLDRGYVLESSRLENPGSDASLLTTTEGATLYFNIYSEEGDLIFQDAVFIPAGTTLRDLVSLVNANITGVKADLVQSEERTRVRIVPDLSVFENAYRVSVVIDDAGGDGVLDFTSSQTLSFQEKRWNWTEYLFVRRSSSAFPDPEDAPTEFYLGTHHREVLLLRRERKRGSSHYLELCIGDLSFRGDEGL